MMNNCNFVVRVFLQRVMKPLLPYKGSILLVTLYRLALVYFFFQVTRVAFYFFNVNLFTEMTFGKMLRYMYYGLIFDTSAILYVNIIFLFLSFLPLLLRYNKWYQKALDWIFIVMNTFALLLNVVDFIYFRYIFKRITAATISLSNEDNIAKLGFSFLIDFWPAVVFFFVMMFLFLWLFKRIKPEKPIVKNKTTYYITSIFLFFLMFFLFIGGVRDGYKHSTRPITISNATQYAEKVEEAPIILNTPFSVIRTLAKDKLKKKNYFTSEQQLDSIFTPIHRPDNVLPMVKKNVVIIILESFSSEFSSYLNKRPDKDDYHSYCPFLDSLMEQGVTFTHAYANGRKSLDALPSVLSSIPEMMIPYLLSPYSTDKISSIPDLLGKEGYTTAFFHGAHNGSMGFEAFCKSAGVKEYYGRENYNNDNDYDGMWGIWDEPFLQYAARKMSEFKEPFCASVFTLSSHHPYKVPRQYEGKFQEGPTPLCKCVTYSDYSLRQFFNTIKTEPWYNNTLFVITADHSISPFHRENTTLEKGFSIPIVYYSPQGDLKGTFNYETQQTDIFPTVMNYLHYPKAYLAFGNDAFDVNGPHFAFNYHSGSYQIISDRFLFQHDGNKPISLFNLEHDQMMNNNLVRDKYQKEKIEKFETQIKAIIQQYNNRVIENRMVVDR